MNFWFFFAEYLNRKIKIYKAAVITLQDHESDLEEFIATQKF